jgi:hypothetical protein
MDGGGTHPWMEEVEPRLERRSRTASGTAVERSLQRILRPRHLHIHVLRNAGAVAEPALKERGAGPLPRRSRICPELAVG